MAAAVILPGLAGATLIQNNGFFTDYLTGLAWRHMSFTDGLSYNAVVESTQAGGENEGYRVATGEEVLGLFNAYLPTELTTSSSWVNVGPGNGSASVFYDMFGITYGNGPDPDCRSIIAYTSTESQGRHLTGGGDVFFGYDRWGSSDSSASSNLGTYMVAIPEPASVGMMGALGVLGWFVRRRFCI